VVTVAGENVLISTKRTLTHTTNLVPRKITSWRVTVMTKWW